MQQKQKQRHINCLLKVHMTKYDSNNCRNTNFKVHHIEFPVNKRRICVILYMGHVYLFYDAPENNNDRCRNNANIMKRACIHKNTCTTMCLQ